MGSASPPAGSPAASSSREDHRVLLNHHMAKIAEANQKVTLARAPLDAARDDLTAAIDNARADLGKRTYTRKRLMGYLEDRTARLRNILAEEEQRYQDRIDLGLPVHGQQQSLFGGDETPAEAKDELAWEAEGYLFGRRGAERTAPEGTPPRFAPAFLKGWDRGQDETKAMFVQAVEAIKRRATPDADAKTVDLNKTEPTEAQKKAAIKASEKLARESLGVPEGGKAKGPRLVAENGGRTVLGADPARRLTMAVRHDNLARYPKDWRTISLRVRERAGWRCEGSPAYPDCRAANGELHPVTGSKVVLAVAHLDHTPENCADQNLRAWCQRCHNTYDAPMRRAGIRARRGLPPDQRVRRKWWSAPQVQRLISGRRAGERAWQIAKAVGRSVSSVEMKTHQLIASGALPRFAVVKRTKIEPAAVFWGFVDQSGGPEACWPWTGTMKRGRYGRVTFEVGDIPADGQAHRVAFFLSNPALPPSSRLTRRCATHHCCNPGHYYAEALDEAA